MAAQQRFRITVAVVVVCSLLPLAYSVFDQSAHRQARPTTGTVRSANAGNRRPGTAMVLQVTPAPYQLPAAVSREVVLPGAGGLLVAGGLTPSGASANTVSTLDPVTGATRQIGRLAQATHDAAGVMLDGRMFVLGGGTAASVPTVHGVDLVPPDSLLVTHAATMGSP